MNTLLYIITQKIIHFALFCYYKEISLRGMTKVPKNKPVLFLANHQNALIDPLVIAACTPFRSYFLTRSDVFVNGLLNSVFSFLRMIPIYRLKDGRDTLGKNEAIFKKCTSLLAHNNSLLLFPEANHNILRRVRPLSKGFTRILFAAFDAAPDMEIYIVPVGINYEKADAFPDRVAFNFADPIPSKAMYDKEDIPGSVVRIRTKVYDVLKESTTHIESESDYEAISEYLDRTGVDYLKPEEVNQKVRGFKKETNISDTINSKSGRAFIDFIFELLNAPQLLLWRNYFKPKIQEIEFISTYRFAYALAIMPLFYILLYLLVQALVSPGIALLSLLGHFLFNLLYVKLR